MLFLVAPLVVLGGAVLASLKGPKLATQALSSAVLFSREIKLRRSEAEVENHKRLNRLDINPEKEKYKADKVEKASKVAEELGVPELLAHEKKRQGVTLQIIEAKDLPEGFDFVIGTYLLYWEELVQLHAGLRAVNLKTRKGADARMLEELCEKAGIEYEQLAYLWSGEEVDFEWLKSVSKERLEDPTFQEMMQREGAPQIS